jgi:hypothetical protein
VLKRGAATRAEGQSFDMLPLSHYSADRVGRGSGISLGVAHREIADSQCGGQVSLKQHWRNL